MLLWVSSLCLTAILKPVHTGLVFTQSISEKVKLNNPIKWLAVNVWKPDKWLSGFQTKVTKQRQKLSENRTFGTQMVSQYLKTGLVWNLDIYWYVLLLQFSWSKVSRNEGFVIEIWKHCESKFFRISWLSTRYCGWTDQIYVCGILTVKPPPTQTPKLVNAILNNRVQISTKKMKKNVTKWIRLTATNMKVGKTGFLYHFRSIHF